MKKAATIEKIYKDPAGFGSIKNTIRDVRKVDSSITPAEIREWIESNREQKKNLSGYNSYIANEPKQEYQIDLFFMEKPNMEEDKPKKKEKIGMIFVDIFTKYTQVAVVDSKQNADILAGLLEGFRKMGGPPQSIYTDEEGSFTTKDFQTLLDEKGVKHIYTRGHPAVAERTIRTLKNMLTQRLEAADKPLSEWAEGETLNQVLFTYNYKMEHSATGMTPIQARENKNHLRVKLNLELHRKSTRKYPEVNVGDRVKVYKEKKPFSKEHVSVWDKKVHTVEGITTSMNQKYYKLSDSKRPLLRHEILKIK